MKTLQELNGSSAPMVIIVPGLDELDERALLPEKVEKARQTLAKIGLPNKKHNCSHGFGASGTEGQRLTHGFSV